MSSSLARKTQRLRPRAFAAGVVAAALAATPALAGTITFCVDKANPMFSVDQAVAKASAAAAKDDAAFVVRDSSTDDEDQDSGVDQAKFLKKLAKHCDLIMDFPVEAGEPGDLPDGMAVSVPYVRTGFVAASDRTLVKSFAAMTRDGKVGVVMLTPASTYFTEANVSAEQVFDTNGDLYAALRQGQVNVALLWQPWLVNELAARPAPLNTEFLAMPHTVWNVVALYPQMAGRSDAVSGFDNGIRALERGGRLAAVIAPFGVPRG
jgi:hypothetical protein